MAITVPDATAALLDVQNTKIFCGFFRAAFHSCGRKQCSGSRL
jgi:hypothetical protein